MKKKLITTRDIFFMAKFIVIYLNKSHDTQKENIFMFQCQIDINDLPNDFMLNFGASNRGIQESKSVVIHCS